MQPWDKITLLSFVCHPKTAPKDGGAGKERGRMNGHAAEPGRMPNAKQPLQGFFLFQADLCRKIAGDHAVGDDRMILNAA